jgi:hypothetical protein
VRIRGSVQSQSTAALLQRQPRQSYRFQETGPAQYHLADSQPAPSGESVTAGKLRNGLSYRLFLCRMNMYKENPMKTCQRCGVEFEPKDDRPNRPAKYCSRKCAQPNQPNSVLLMCRQCGVEFRRKAYMADWSQERGPFCGFRCYGAWQKVNTIGAANPNFVPVSPRRRSAQWVRNRLLVLERDSHQCRLCGSTRRLHVHHIHEWSQDDPSTHAMDNLLTLCASCHRKQHPMPHRPDGSFAPIR